MRIWRFSVYSSIPAIFTSHCAILLPFLQAFGLKINQGSRMAEGSTSRRPALLFQPGRLRKQRRRESAFVAKYEITLDECLAWTKAKSRPLC